MKNSWNLLGNYGINCSTYLCFSIINFSFSWFLQKELIFIFIILNGFCDILEKYFLQVIFLLSTKSDWLTGSISDPKHTMTKHDKPKAERP